MLHVTSLIFRILYELVLSGEGAVVAEFFENWQKIGLLADKKAVFGVFFYWFLAVTTVTVFGRLVLFSYCGKCNSYVTAIFKPALLLHLCYKLLQLCYRVMLQGCYIVFSLFSIRYK